jgi:hypothetical protein
VIPDLVSTPISITQPSPTFLGEAFGTASLEPTATALPIPVLPTPAPLPLPLVPSATPQLSPALSSSVIQILTPGPMSRVLSPIAIHAYVIPGYGNKVRVELYGEDGQLVYRKILSVYTDVFKWAYLSLDISFSTRAAAELGRLQISTEDAAGNIIALGATHLLLMKDGYEEITPSGITSERCVFNTPAESATIVGGILAVSGTYYPFNTQPLILELVGEDGSILGSQWMEVPANSASPSFNFNADMTYSVSALTPAYLVARQFDQRINGLMYLFSQPVILLP